MENENMFFSRKRGVALDLSNRCALECPRCRRSYDFKLFGLKVPGGSISMENFKKLLKFHEYINFEGTVSDPVHHESFIEFLKMCYATNKRVEVHTASSAKSKEWYIEAFKANPNASWRFSLDGLPEESKTYRINQDGPKLFDIMVESIKHLHEKPVWQYIVFRYNENSVDDAIALAKEVGLKFYIVRSSRWWGDDWLMPTKSEYKIKAI